METFRWEAYDFIYSPPEITGEWDVYYYQFLGKKPPFDPINGTMVMAEPSDGCHAFTNADQINGKIAAVTSCKSHIQL
jgi:hypothetical protein